MVIRLGTGPAVSASDLRLLRRLVGPTDWSGTEPTGRSCRCRVWLVAAHYSRAANDAGLVSSVCLQSRRLAGDHCSHTMSYLINGARASREELAAYWRPASPSPAGLASAVFRALTAW